MDTGHTHKSSHKFTVSIATGDKHTMFKRQFLEPFANLVNYVFVPVNRP